MHDTSRELLEILSRLDHTTLFHLASEHRLRANANGGHGGFQQILMHAAQTNVKDEKNGADADHENHEARVILECVFEDTARVCTRANED